MLSFWQIWNMSFGFLGIQVGWGMQMGNMSAIYEYLGAKPDQIPILWLAAPMTGLIVQPIIGYMSDRTWGRWGRRKPYFTVGAILATLALIAMPHASALWMAAGLLWILDASINISMEPFRAFVGDLLPESQINRGYTMQSMFIGIGNVLAALLPSAILKIMGEGAQQATHGVPPYLVVVFKVGALCYLAAVLYTVLTTKEYPPADMEAFEREKAETAGFLRGVKEVFSNIFNMPKTMRQVALVQFFTWPGLFLMWFYFTPAVARDILGASDTKSPLYAEGVAWGNICFGFYSAVCFLFSFILPALADRFSRRYTHMACLAIGAVGLLYVGFTPGKYWLLLSMLCVGIAWASILSMPYAMLASTLPPNKLGVFMGIFNFFIVLPEIIATLFFGPIMEHVLGNDRIAAVMVGGALLAVASVLCLQIREEKTPAYTSTALSPLKGAEVGHR
ncbi:MAG: MFS transporter [Saprospiraceae bacterium]|nr:MFS transporter [Saprospiraceae bacterium]MDW8228594.1 MFS transporter [Saprospiraceae bacterium]